MSRITITIKPKYVEQYEKRFPGKVDSAISRYLHRAVQVAKSHTPVGPTGQLRSNIKSRKIPKGFEIGWLAPYASEVEFGTLPHWIQPVAKKALRWLSGGKAQFSKGHKVRGIKPQKFAERTGRQVKREFEDILKKRLKKSR